MLVKLDLYLEIEEPWHEASQLAKEIVRQVKNRAGSVYDDDTDAYLGRFNVAASKVETLGD